MGHEYLRGKILQQLQIWNKNMSGSESKQQTTLHMKAVTWLKDSHSLFDYEFNKNVNQETFDFSLEPKFVFMYRNNKTSQINVTESLTMQPGVYQNFQLLGCFQMICSHKKSFIQFHHAREFQQFKKDVESVLLTEESGQSPTLDNKEEDIYLIVRSLKNKHNQNKGYKLEVGQTIKFGRIQYKVSSIKRDKVQENPEVNSQSGNYFLNKQVLDCDHLNGTEEDQCKYCLEGQIEGEDNFFISPCKCSGTSGLVHYKCLQQWIQSKVKKEVTGGTLHYNFEKFFCQVCKDQFPRFIKKAGNTYELMHINKPEGSHLILEGLTEKSKNLMVIQNIPEDGIKIGRSHECDIRVTDISVSRNHAFIEKIDDEFYIFDSKSKFGSLVKEEELTLQLSKIKQGIQIGRTVFTFELSKKLSN